MADDIYLDKEDISVREIRKELCDCEEGPITHFVEVDFRSAGFSRDLGDYCESCATELAKRIRQGLKIGGE